MPKVEYVLSALSKIEQTVVRVIDNSESITSYNYYYMSPAGMERLESIFDRHGDAGAGTIKQEQL